MESIGKLPIGSYASMGNMEISVLTTYVVQESLVLLLLDDSPYVSIGSCVTMAFIGKFPTGSCVLVGKIGISMLTTYVVQEYLILLILDDSPLILDLFLFLCGVRKEKNSPVFANGSTSSNIVPLISEEVSISTI